jgi:hypothetical protein
MVRKNILGHFSLVENGRPDKRTLPEKNNQMNKDVVQNIENIENIEKNFE